MATTPAIVTKELLKYRVEEGVAVFELDDPPANTYSYEMMQQLDAAILMARMDDSVHVIVIRGAGEKFFCAGASIPMLTKADATLSIISVCTPTRRCAALSRRPSWSSLH